MRLLLTIFLLLVLITPVLSQTRSNILYGTYLKGGEGQFDVAVGVDHAFQISRKKWSSGRLYFVTSPNLLWSGYESKPTTDGAVPHSHLDKYELALPLLLRYELALNRVILGSKPGKHDYDISIFFDTGISLNYLLRANLSEQFNYSFQSTNFRYSFDESITSTVQNRITAHYLAFGLGMRFNRFTFFLRAFQPFAKTRYANLSRDWALPDGVQSFFYDKYPTNPFYNQGTFLLCIGYYF